MDQLEWLWVDDRQLEFRCGDYEAMIWRATDGTWLCILECQDGKSRRGEEFQSASEAKSWCVQEMLGDQLQDLLEHLHSRLPRSRSFH